MRRADSLRIRGASGEKLAEKALRKRGAKILERNFSCPMGEIDLIARQGVYLLFVEVKLRKAQTFVSGEEAIGREKRRRILKTAQAYLKIHPSELQPRFDAAILNEREDGSFSLEYYENAFDAAEVFR